MDVGGEKHGGFNCGRSAAVSSHAREGLLTETYRTCTRGVGSPTGGAGRAKNGGNPVVLVVHADDQTGQDGEQGGLAEGDGAPKGPQGAVGAGKEGDGGERGEKGAGGKGTAEVLKDGLFPGLLYTSLGRLPRRTSAPWRPRRDPALSATLPESRPSTASLGVLSGTCATSARFDADLSNWVGLRGSLSSLPLQTCTASGRRFQRVVPPTVEFSTAAWR